MSKRLIDSNHLMFSLTLAMISLVLCLTLFSFAVSSPALKSLNEIRIVGGEDIDIVEAPYQVSLVRLGRHSCGGAIIGSDLVVTAAHCVLGTQPESWQIRVGSSSSEGGGELYPVGDLTWHLGFTYSNMDSDIALLWLARPLIFNDKVAPIELADENDEIIDGELTTVTGWGHLMEGGGFPSTLQKVLVPKVNEELCNEYYKPVYEITPRMLCAGVDVGGKDACQGDSGGPLVYNNKLAGVVSWGLGCARPDFPGVYARVSALRDWLDENIILMKMKHMNILREV